MCLSTYGRWKLAIDCARIFAVIVKMADRNNSHSLHFNDKNYKTNFLLFQTFWMNQKYISYFHVIRERPLYKHYYYYHKMNGLKKLSEMRDSW